MRTPEPLKYHDLNLLGKPRQYWFLLAFRRDRAERRNGLCRLELSFPNILPAEIFIIVHELRRQFSRNEVTYTIPELASTEMPWHEKSNSFGEGCSKMFLVPCLKGSLSFGSVPQHCEGFASPRRDATDLLRLRRRAHLNNEGLR